MEICLENMNWRMEALEYKGENAGGVLSLVRGDTLTDILRVTSLEVHNGKGFVPLDGSHYNEFGVVELELIGEGEYLIVGEIGDDLVQRKYLRKSVKPLRVKGYATPIVGAKPVIIPDPYDFL